MTTITGRLVLDDEVTPGTITIEDGVIASVGVQRVRGAGADGPYIAPGFVDVHVHGGGGHDAMGGRAALDGMARHLLRHGVTSFLPTGVSAPLDDLYRFVDEVRDWMPVAPADGSQPLGSNLEGPWLSDAKRARTTRALLRAPADLRLRGPGSPPRRPAAGDGRAGDSRGARAHRLAARPRRRDVDGPLGGDRSRRPAPATRPAAPRRPTCSTAMSGVDHRAPGSGARRPDR